MSAFEGKAVASKHPSECLQIAEGVEEVLGSARMVVIPCLW